MQPYSMSPLCQLKELHSACILLKSPAVLRGHGCPIVLNFDWLIIDEARIWREPLKQKRCESLKTGILLESSALHLQCLR
jgi:hypothetical protein